MRWSALFLSSIWLAPASAQQCACDGDVASYCTAGTSSAGCVAALTATGLPSAGLPSGFLLSASGVDAGRSGLFLYGRTASALPFGSGGSSWLCVAAPLRRTPRLDSGGSPGACDGSLALDFNALLAANPAALGAPLAAGQSCCAQAWLRDPQAPLNGLLSAGLRFVLCQPDATGPCIVPAGLVPIPAGSFLMGSSAGPGAPYYNGLNPPQPVHAVTISYPFWMGATEVTQGEYAALMGNNPSSFFGLDHPVERVSWHDARAYCAALTAQQAALGRVPAGYEYRLPTEAEWEYACRAGTASEFSVGPALECPDAAFALSDHSGTSCLRTSTAPVASFAPNPWGLHDMHGNVFEWCLDSFAAYPASAVVDPFVSGGTYRVIRGGFWGAASRYCRSAARAFYQPGLVDSGRGLRVVLAPVRVP